MKVLRALSAALVIAAGAWVLYTFAPTAYGFYPQCVFKQVTGLDCPGCGSITGAHRYYQSDTG